MHTYIHTHKYIHTYIHIYIHTHIHTYIRTYVCMYVQTYTYTTFLFVIYIMTLSLSQLMCCQMAECLVPNELDNMQQQSVVDQFTVLFVLVPGVAEKNNLRPQDSHCPSLHSKQAPSKCMSQLLLLDAASRCGPASTQYATHEHTSNTNAVQRQKRNN